MEMTWIWFLLFCAGMVAAVVLWFSLYRETKDVGRFDIQEENIRLKAALLTARCRLKEIAEWDDDSDMRWDDPGCCAQSALKSINEALRK